MVENSPQSLNCGSDCAPLTYNVDTRHSVEQRAEQNLIAVTLTDSSKRKTCDFWY
jgi:hypothetical protein